MKYEEMVKMMAERDRTDIERGEIIIREVGKLIDNIMDYNFTRRNYDGGGTGVEDKRNIIKNTLALVKSDIDIYMEQLGITEGVMDKSSKRLEKLSKRVVK